jgi:4-hydroxy-3-methylbut-2-enyl diphosphate reductase IspH
LSPKKYRNIKFCFNRLNNNSIFHLHLYSNGKVFQNVEELEYASVPEVQPQWFKPNQTVGICGATSTPAWLMDDIKKYIEKF